jgi:hypothetical protein
LNEGITAVFPQVDFVLIPSGALRNPQQLDMQTQQLWRQGGLPIIAGGINQR